MNIETQDQIAAVMLHTGTARQKKGAFLYLMGTAPNGCYDRAPLAETVIVQTGWTDYIRDGYGMPHRVATHAEIPNPMAKDCQYTKTAEGKADKRCMKCIWNINKPESSENKNEPT